MGKYSTALHKQHRTIHPCLLARMKPRTRSDFTIWSLPEELIIMLLNNLHIRDLLNMRMVHPYFRELIDSNSIIWSTVSFASEWPVTANISHFERASSNGNLEALIKLGIAYLYNEGLPGKFEGNKIMLNGERAASLFCQAETLTNDRPAFTWLFIRPPWSTGGACCKECVFNNMKNYCNQNPNKSVEMCLSQVLQLFEDNSEKQIEALTHAENAANMGCSLAAFKLWNHKYNNKVHDRGDELESVRALRDVTTQGDLEPTLKLCKMYASGKNGGLNDNQTMVFIQDFVRSSDSTNIQQVFKWNTQLTNSMRYILVDWLVEVASMKDFTTQTLHVAISLLDRYLLLRNITRSKLQLLGVSAMVVCSRFIGKDIITIREAAWLTDNTYKYEDVVRMMGEIISSVRGRIRVVMALDYLEVFCMLAATDRRTQVLAEYICELSLLHAELGKYSKAQVAAGCLLLARLLTKQEYPWPSKLQEGSGYKVQDITGCTLHIHVKCFVEKSITDHRDVELEAVKQRYSDDSYLAVSTDSSIEIMTSEELCGMLGVVDRDITGSELRIHFRNTKNLIMSPSRRDKHKKFDNRCRNELTEGRKQAVTPTLEMEEDFFNDSGMSGYYGDKEDEEESYMDCDDSEDDDDDLVSLWCAELPPTPPVSSDGCSRTTRSSKVPNGLNQLVPNICMSSPEAASMFSCSKVGQCQHQGSPVVPDTVTTRSRGLLACSDLDSPASFSETLNTNSFSIYMDTDRQNSRIYETRSSANGSNSSIALRSRSNNIVCNTNSPVSFQKAVGKRKRAQQANTERKTRVMLC